MLQHGVIFVTKCYSTSVLFWYLRK